MANKLAKTRPSSGTALTRVGGGVIVPSTYQSDKGPAISLESMDVNLSGSHARDGGPKRNSDGAATPLRMRLEFDCNAEGVARLAEFFGFYDREAWNGMARAKGLPECATPALPPAPEPIEGELLDPDE